MVLQGQSHMAKSGIGCAAATTQPNLNVSRQKNKIRNNDRGLDNNKPRI
jgi:hypothetical protein